MVDIVETIVKVIICHVVGDYLFQTDYMAREKGKDWYLLFVHCVCYCVPFIYVFGMNLKVVALFIPHIWIDALKARYNEINIVTDQLLHYFFAIVLYVL